MRNNGRGNNRNWYKIVLLSSSSSSSSPSDRRLKTLKTVGHLSSSTPAKPRYYNVTGALHRIRRSEMFVQRS